MKLVAITFQSVEDICAAELKGKVLDKGRVIFPNIKENIKSADCIYKLFKDCTIQDLEEIQKAAQDVEIPKNKSIKVICKRSGDHLFKSIDVEKAVGEVLHERGHKINIKNPEQKLFVDILENKCRIGLLMQEQLCRREYRVKFNNQSISPCLAFCLLKLIDLKKDDSFLDPLCKDGVIAIEAALLGCKKVFASDPNKNSVRNAVINARMAKVSVEPVPRSIDQMEKAYGKEGVDKLATVLITSKKDKYAAAKLHEFFSQAKVIVRKTINILSNTDQIKEYIPKECKTKEERWINVGKARYYLISLRKK